MDGVTCLVTTAWEAEWKSILPKRLHFHHGREGGSSFLPGGNKSPDPHLAFSDGTRVWVWGEWGSHLSKARAEV